MGIVFGLAAWSMFGAATLRVDVLDVEVRPVLSVSGKTVLDLPPLGSVSAWTHRSPVNFVVRPTNVAYQGLDTYISNRPTAEEFTARLGVALKDWLPSYAIRALLTGLLGGLVAVALIRPRRRHAVASIVAAALAPIAVLSLAAVTYRVEGFREPEITGTLSAAPQIAGSLERASEQFDEFRQQLELMGATAFRLYRFLEDQSEIPPDAIRILHISDIHLNPIGYDLAVSISRAFKVDMVVDTGDSTLEGGPLEGGFVADAEKLGVPYVWVEGNHDSDLIAAQVDSLPNGTVLDRASVTMEGIKIYGVSDPVRSSISDPITVEAQAEIRRTFAPTVDSLVRQEQPLPDILMVHERAVARTLAGDVPIVLSGHSHCTRWIRSNGTYYLTVGSAGAGSVLKGIAPVKAPDVGQPYEFQILYLTSQPATLVAIDRIQAREGGSRLSVTRTRFDAEKRDGLLFTSCPRGL